MKKATRDRQSPSGFVFVNVMPQYLGSISFARGELVICILIRRHAVVVGLVIVLAITAVPDSHALQDKFDIIWNKGERNSYICATLWCISEILD